MTSSGCASTPARRLNHAEGASWPRVMGGRTSRKPTHALVIWSSVSCPSRVACSLYATWVSPLERRTRPSASSTGNPRVVLSRGWMPAWTQELSARQDERWNCVSGSLRPTGADRTTLANISLDPGRFFAACSESRLSSEVSFSTCASVAQKSSQAERSSASNCSRRSAVPLWGAIDCDSRILTPRPCSAERRAAATLARYLGSVGNEAN